MNSRIDPLIEQCTIQQFSDCVGGYETFDREKFAELIVRECANVAAKNQAEDMSWDISEIIKEHFGIEE